MKKLLTQMTITLLFGQAQARNEFNCNRKILIEYAPGVHWSKLETILPKHLEFTTEQFKTGQLDFGGPLITEEGEPTGGLAIYNGPDLQTVETLVKNDPLVKEGVAVFAAKAWIQCVPTQGELK